MYTWIKHFIFYIKVCFYYIYMFVYCISITFPLCLAAVLYKEDCQHILKSQRLRRVGLVPVNRLRNTSLIVVVTPTDRRSAIIVWSMLEMRFNVVTLLLGFSIGHTILFVPQDTWTQVFETALSSFGSYKFAHKNWHVSYCKLNRLRNHHIERMKRKQYTMYMNRKVILDANTVK